MTSITSEMIARVTKGQAYWLQVPLDHLTAVGAITAHWGMYEMAFDSTFQILGTRPDTTSLIEKIPSSFKGRTELLRELARICFQDSPSMVEKICDYTVRALALCRKRNLFAHGWWFDFSPFAESASMGVTIMSKTDGTGDFYSVTLEQLETLAVKIHALNAEHATLLLITTDTGGP
jgi:hypothetical protein